MNQRDAGSEANKGDIWLATVPAQVTALHLSHPKSRHFSVASAKV
jgi:hypothetical protein